MLLQQHQNFSQRYPTTQDQAELMRMTGIGKKQLKNWFTNARRRIWKPLIKKQLEVCALDVVDSYRSIIEKHSSKELDFQSSRFDQEAKNQAANGHPPMDSQRAAVVASAAQAAGITRGIDGTFTTSTDLDDGGGGGGGSVRGRTGRSIGGGRGGRNNAINCGAHGMGGDMGYGIGMGGRNYGEIGYHDPNCMATYTAGMPRAPSVGKIGDSMKKTDSMAFLESFLQEEVKMAEAKQQSGGIPTHPSAMGGYPGVLPNYSQHHGMHAPPMRDSNYGSYNNGHMNTPAGMSIDGDEEGGSNGVGAGSVSGESSASNSSKKRPLSEMTGSSEDYRGEQQKMSGSISSNRTGSENLQDDRTSSQQQQSGNVQGNDGSSSPNQQQGMLNDQGPNRHQQEYNGPRGSYPIRYYGDNLHGYHDNYHLYPPHPMQHPGGYGVLPGPMHGYPGGGYDNIPTHSQVHPRMMNPHYPPSGEYYYPQDRGPMMMAGGPHAPMNNAQHEMNMSGGPPMHNRVGMHGGYYNPLAGHPQDVDGRRGFDPYMYHGHQGGRGGPYSDRPPGGPPPQKNLLPQECVVRRLWNF